MTKEKLLSDDCWEHCRTGTLQKVITLRRRDRQRRRWIRASTGVTLLLASTITATQVFTPRAPLKPEAMISCEEVAELLPDFLANRLSPELWASVDLHVRNCAVCRQRIEEMRNGSLADDARGIANAWIADLRPRHSDFPSHE